MATTSPRAPPDSVLILSPHLDDAVFACGRLLASVAEATVATLFAGPPPPDAAPTEWDRAAGFAPGEDVIAARRDEDARALGVLGARPRWLDLHDSQYGASPSMEEVAGHIAPLLAELPDAAVLFPLGLFHSDHRLASDAALRLLPDHPARLWVAYEDALYRRLGELAAARLAGLVRQGFVLTPLAFVEGPGAADAKRRAVACYRSQLLALASPGRPGLADLDGEETWWRIATRGEARQ